MDAKTYPLQEILKPERRYIIPTFQRDYEWTQNGQWQLLFEDLETTADRLTEVRESEADGSNALKNREKLISPHFLGAIVCAGLPFATGGVALRSVIDGQQRLTTMQLLVRGLLDVLQESGSERTKSVRRMLFNPEDVTEKPEEVYKLWPRRRDRDLWPIAMADDVPVYDEKNDHLYLQARRFFADSVRASVTTEGSDVSAMRLTALADALMSLFKLVVIDLDDNDDAQVIFEVLNGRQTPLAAIDLVKNLLFLRGELDEADVERLYDEYWSPFDEDWWKREVGRGHAARGRRDVLISVWLTAVTGTEASVAHLYRESRDYLNQPGAPDTEAVLVELSAYARAYRVIYGADAAEDARLRVSYDRLNALEITTAVPLLAWLRTQVGDSLAVADHVRAVLAIESWALRRAFTGAQTRGYGTHLTRVLREAKAAADAGLGVADAVIEGLAQGALGWPTDEDLEDAFLTKRFYGPVPAGRLRLLFTALDDRLRRDNPHEPQIAITVEGLQIEHVLPQSWMEHWPIIDRETGEGLDILDPRYEDAARRRRSVIDGIGNLTLVTQAFNRDVSNLGWSAKQPEFAKQTAIVLNKRIATEPEWSEDAIEARSRSLAKVAQRVWPSPGALLGADGEIHRAP